MSDLALVSERKPLVTNILCQKWRPAEQEDGHEIIRSLSCHRGFFHRLWKANYHAVSARNPTTRHKGGIVIPEDPLMRSSELRYQSALGDNV